MSYQELWETTMDPEHRILKQVHIEDAAAADETFSMLMATTWNRAVFSSNAMPRMCASSTLKVLIQAPRGGGCQRS